MKLKLDFITNSSTVCFVVIGTILDPKDIPKDFLKYIQERENIDYINLSESAYNYIDYFIKGSDLEYSTGDEYDEQLMIGIPFTKMKDDETLAEFRRRVRLQILECFGIKITPNYIEEAWRDG